MQSACPPIRIDSRLLQISATTLLYPTPKYQNGAVDWIRTKEAKDGKWNLNGRKFLHTNSATEFKVYLIAVSRKAETPKFTEKVIADVWAGFFTAAQHTYNTGKFRLIGQKICSSQTQKDDIPREMNNAKQRGANFVILLLENKDVAAYSIVKDLADRTHDMHSLCMVYKERQGRAFSPQYWANVMMKVNMKAGGMNHTVSEVEAIMENTLVLGA